MVCILNKIITLTKAGKQFKVFFLDIGLLVRRSRLDFRNMYLKKELTATFNGTLAEQFVAQQLIAKNNTEPC